MLAFTHATCNVCNTSAEGLSMSRLRNRLQCSTHKQTVHSQRLEQPQVSNRMMQNPVQCTCEVKQRGLTDR